MYVSSSLLLCGGPHPWPCVNAIPLGWGNGTAHFFFTISHPILHLSNFAIPLGPVHTGRGAPCNTRMQIMEYIVVNGSVHTACKQHQRCVQMCLRVLCERGLRGGGSWNWNWVRTSWRTPSSAVPFCVVGRGTKWYIWGSSEVREDSDKTVIPLPRSPKRNNTSGEVQKCTWTRPLGYPPPQQTAYLGRFRIEWGITFLSLLQQFVGYLGTFRLYSVLVLRWHPHACQN